MAVLVIVFNTLWNDRLQAVFRVRLAICYPSYWFDLSPDYRAKPLVVSVCSRTLTGSVRYGWQRTDCRNCPA